MATKTQVRVRLHEHLVIDGAVRLMAGRAALAQRFMLEHKTPRLFAMAVRALLVQSRHGQAASRFHDVKAMRVVALHAIHLPFAHRMVLRKIKLRVHVEVAREARLRIAAGIHNEFSAASADDDMLAGRTMT